MIAAPQLIALGLQDILQQAGFLVMDPVSSNSKALAFLSREQPDAVLLDCELSDGRATPVVQALQSAGIPFAVMTGEAVDGLTEVTFKIAPRLLKPFSEEDVVRIVWQLIAECPASPGDPSATALDGAAP